MFRPTIELIVRNPFVFRLAAALSRVVGRGGLTAADARILGLLQILAGELGKPQSVKHLAAQLRLSLSRFEHLFKEETGQNLTAFVRGARMTRAKNMLQDPTMRIKEVAAAVGCADASHFSRDFKKQYGRSPSRSRSPSP